MQIHVARGDQRFGPYTDAEVSTYLASGRLSPGDLAWHKGAEGWVPLAQLFPYFATPAAAAKSPVQSGPSSFPAADGAAHAGLRLYNPNAAANWCLLFSPAFGAFLHARNWRTLGDLGRARANMFWFYGFFVFLAAVTFLPLPTSATNSLGLAVLLAWYFSQGKKQVEHVKVAFPNGYPKRSLLLPLLTAAGAFTVFIMVIFWSVSASPEQLAQALIEDVRPSLLTEWSKNPNLPNPKIEHISLAPVNGSSSNFAGDLDASFNGQKQSLRLEVTFDQKTKRMSWKTLAK